MGEIIDQIWSLPWYKVLVVAVVDDLILLFKIWPAYVILIVLVVFFVVAKRI